MNVPPCKKDGVPCPKRELGCHSKCDEYLEYAQSRFDISEKRKHRNERDSLAIDGINRTKRYKHCQKWR